MICKSHLLSANASCHCDNSCFLPIRSAALICHYRIPMLSANSNTIWGVDAANWIYEFDNANSANSVWANSGLWRLIWGVDFDLGILIWGAFDLGAGLRKRWFGFACCGAVSAERVRRVSSNVVMFKSCCRVYAPHCNAQTTFA